MNRQLMSIQQKYSDLARQAREKRQRFEAEGKSIQASKWRRLEAMATSKAGEPSADAHGATGDDGAGPFGRAESWSKIMAALGFKSAKSGGGAQ
jgi:hypothetical protein